MDINPDGVVASFQSMPKWQIFLVVAAGGGLAWFLTNHKTSSNTESTDSAPDGFRKSKRKNDEGAVTPWRQRASATLTSRGYPQSEVNSALDHYLGRGTMTPRDTSLISVAIQSVGTPDIQGGTGPSYDVSSPQTSPGPGAPYAGNSDLYNGGVGNDINFTADSEAPSYWFQPSSGFGNTSTFTGLALLYYGDATKATAIMNANPGAASSVWQPIPFGYVVKIPRNVNA